jgi:50S ribosomal subunit-associated GTPase HflX
MDLLIVRSFICCCSKSSAGATLLDRETYVHARALIFVIDAQDEPYDDVLQKYTETVLNAIEANPTIAIEVFINKGKGKRQASSRSSV